MNRALTVMRELALFLQQHYVTKEEREFIHKTIDQLGAARNEHDVDFAITIVMRHRDLFPDIVEVVEDALAN